MREEPVVSSGILKLALVLLVAGGLGVGAYALAGGGIGLPDLPDLPQADTSGGVTDLKDTTLRETTIDAQPAPAEVPEPAVIPPAARRAQKLNDCVAAAGDDTEAIFRCLDRFR